MGSLLQMVVSVDAQKWINNACSSTVTGQLKLITNGSLTVNRTAAGCYKYANTFYNKTQIDRKGKSWICIFMANN